MGVHKTGYHGYEWYEWYQPIGPATPHEVSPKMLGPMEMPKEVYRIFQFGGGFDLSIMGTTTLGLSGPTPTPTPSPPRSWESGRGNLPRGLPVPP